MPSSALRTFRMAQLSGACLQIWLSGFVCAQSLIYFICRKRDRLLYRLVVAHQAILSLTATILNMVDVIKVCTEAHFMVA